MIENGMRYLRGYVKIQIQGYSPESFFESVFLSPYFNRGDWPMKITAMNFV